jgi:hypothetical protein
VRKSPAPWLWMYKHWRYRPANADRPYPFYVRPSRGFEKVIQRNQGNFIGETRMYLAYEDISEWRNPK